MLQCTYKRVNGTNYSHRRLKMIHDRVLLRLQCQDGYMIIVNVICNTKARNRSIPLIVRSFAAPVPILQNDFSQQVVQAESFVRSPTTIHPESHLLVHFLSTDQVCGLDVESSVLVV